jgi:outer membrane protein
MLVLTTPMAAQSARSGATDRGSMLIAGSASLSHTSGEGSSATNMSLQPSLHYFVANRIALGGELGYSYTDFDNGSATSWRLGPAARLYFGSATAKVLPYLGTAVQFGSGSAKTERPVPNETDASLWGIQGIAGLTFMISRNVGISGEAFLQREESTFETSTAKVTTTLTQYGLRFGVAAFVF